MKKRPTWETKAKEESGLAASTDPAWSFLPRFDLNVNAMVHKAFPIAGQQFVNAARALAVLFSRGLVGCGFLHHDNAPAPVGYSYRLIVGLLATRLTFIAKDLSSAFATAVNALQATTSTSRMIRFLDVRVASSGGPLVATEQFKSQSRISLAALCSAD